MGLIIPRNRLVYPGGNPGFNSSHMAAKGVRLSIVANPTGGIPRIITAPGATGPFTAHGTVTSSVLPAGPAINATATSTNYLSIPAKNETPNAVTFGAIITPAASTPNGVLFSTNGTSGSGGPYFQLVGLSPTLNPPTDVGPTLTVGRTYFVGASYNKTTVNYVVVDLFSGLVRSSTANDAAGISATTASEYDLFSLGSTGLAVNTALSAFAYSVNNYLSLPQLLQWAQAPWDFWYPPTVRQQLFSSLKGGAAVDSLSFALTDPVETAAFTLTEKDQFHFALTDPVETAAFTLTDAKGITFALTDPVETAAFSLTEKDQFNFALTDPVETAAFSLAKQESFHFALTDSVETAAFALTNVKGFHFALTDPVETAAFALTDTQPIPQPGPQIAFPLRERTYRRRFLGVGYDPKFVITKDRPGPIRIIEFIGEMKDD